MKNANVCSQIVGRQGPWRGRAAWRSAAWALCALLGAGGALAQDTAAGSQSDAKGPRFVISGFDIVGENPLADGEVATLLAPFLRNDATLETLQKATAALESRLKERGFALHRVALPPQDVGGSVKLNIVKFVIGKVVVEGHQQFSAENIRASLPELREGSSPNFQTLTVQTTLANENPAKQIQVALKESEEPDKIDVRIGVRESKPLNLALSASNTGSSATGTDRVTFSGSHANLFDLDHQFTAAYTTSLQRPGDVRQLGLNYRAPLYRLGGVASLNYTQSDVVGDFGTFRSNGAGQTFGLGYSHYRPAQGGYRGFFSVGLETKQFDIAQINGVALAGQLARRTQPLTLGYSARVEADAATWGYNTDLVFNLPGGAGNDLEAYQSEDPRVSNVRWSALRGGANYTTAWGSGWLWGVRGQFQYSADALISGEQFGVGGASSVRGTGERPLAGDSGVQVSMELTTPELLSGLRLVGFLDAGWLGNRNSSTGLKPASDSLSSIGLGLRYALPRLVLSADYGRVVGGSSMPYTEGSGIPQSGDHKLHFNLSTRF